MYHWRQGTKTAQDIVGNPNIDKIIYIYIYIATDNGGFVCTWIINSCVILDYLYVNIYIYLGGSSHCRRARTRP